MKKQQLAGLLLLALVSAAGIAWASALPEEKPAGEGGSAAYEKLLDAAPAARMEGQTVSPDGRFEIRAIGKSQLVCSGIAAPEAIQITDRGTGGILWQDEGYLWQSALWSQDSRYLALACAGRTWSKVKIFETGTWTAWDVTLPDGGGIPEYTFLPEDWGAWLPEGEILPESLRLTVGRGGDGEEQTVYRCVPLMDGGALTGVTEEQTAEPLPGTWDFDHDGQPENGEVLTFWSREGGKERRGECHELLIPTAGGLWSCEAAEAHAGWISVFACRLDGQDYLLRYNPAAGQGSYAYIYEIFSLAADGTEIPYRENSVEFDMMFGSTAHDSFEPEKIAAFLTEVHGYLDESTLLMTTNNGEFRTGGSGADFREDMDFWDEACPYDEKLTLAENLDRLRTAER